MTVTAYSPYQAYPGPAPAIAPEPPPILVAVADPEPQRRVTVFFRLLLLVPHAIVLGVLGMVAGIVAFIGWWGALFTGQLPEFAVDFLSGFLRWSTRVTAYEFLLTDVYPPFTFDDDPAYPVRVAIPEPQQLNRAAVFFRCFLALPAALLLSLVSAGAGTLMGFIAWLVTLFTGHMPASLHHAYVAFVRYQARYTGYYHMLTPAYPWGLYGDGPEAVAWAYGVPQGNGARPVFQPATWLLPLTSAAKKLVTAFIVIGSLFLVVAVVLYAVLIAFAVSAANDSQTATTAITQLNNSYGTLTNTMNVWESAITHCNQSLTCVTKEDGTAAGAFNTFSSQLSGTVVPAGADADKAQLSAVSTAAGRDFTKLSQATSVAQYRSTLTSTGLQQTLDSFDSDYTAFIDELQSYVTTQAAG
jgi:hypothetical protein